MYCPICGHRCSVMRTRMRSESVVRRRVCDSCGNRFNTTETIVLEGKGEQALRKGATIDRELDEDFDRRARRVGYRSDYEDDYAIRDDVEAVETILREMNLYGK